MIYSVEWEVMSRGRNGEPLWFHPRACTYPGEAGIRTVFMTAQGISGSDFFQPVHYMSSSDIGRSWSRPKPIPGFGRSRYPDNATYGSGVEAGVCDVVPDYHPATGRILCIGHTVFYRDGSFFLPQPPRYPAYAVFDPRSNSWISSDELPWDRAAEMSIYSSGCAQRHTEQDGTILLPLTFRPAGTDAARVTTIRMAFDGEHCTITEQGTELSLEIARGLLEPTITRFADRFFLSIRAEDGNGYRAVSSDGLHWEQFGPWRWDDGTQIPMSSTQSRWLPHSKALYLVYVRQDAMNRNVMRWRAPLYAARVDIDSMRIVRESEKIVVPLRGDGIHDPDHVARLGNFHTVAVTPNESWVTVGETLPNDGWKGDTIISRIRWREPNTIAR